MSNPHLEAVQSIDRENPSAPAPSASDSAPQSGEPAPSESKTGSGVPVWLFLLAIVGLGLVIGWQLQVKGELEGEIAGLTEELAATQSLLGAHESRLGEIRSGVRDLTSQLAGLATLVEADVSGDGGNANGRQTSATTRPAEPAPARREIPARLSR